MMAAARRRGTLINRRSSDQRRNAVLDVLNSKNHLWEK
jgi:hypothetical protein